MHNYDEHRDLHPRVAHLLEVGGWCYIHEYDYGVRRPDFIAIHRMTGQVAIIECKIVLAAQGLTHQINSYYRDFGLPQAGKHVFVLVEPTKNHVKRFNAKGVQVTHVGMDTPSAVIHPKKKTKNEFSTLFRSAYGRNPLPLANRSRAEQFHHFPNDVDVSVSDVNPRYWPEMLDLYLDSGLELRG